MTLTNEEIQIVRLLCDIVTDLPSPENEQVEKLLKKAETFLITFGYSNEQSA